MTVSTVAAKPPELYEADPATANIALHFHSGQERAYEATERLVVVLAGTQGGKTSFIPWWLLREIETMGQGDYLVAAPTFKILEPKILPSFLEVFKRLLNLGDMVRSPVMRFTFSEAGARKLLKDRFDPAGPPIVVYFGHAANPDSLESATYKAACLDECGQDDFKQASYEAILRRLSLAMGRILFTTTVYQLGWMKSVLYDAWRRGDPTIKVIHFDSTENPKFPRAEWERARESLPAWKFEMFYRGRFSRPAGVIYDCYDEERHEIEPPLIPDEWRRFIGLDFGGVNTAATFWALRPTDNRLICYREYLEGGRTAKQHVAALLEGEPKHRLPLAYGGSHSEQQWRDEFVAAGLPVAPSPIVDVEVGIQRVYGTIKRDEVRVVNTLDRLRSEMTSYSRELDESYEPTEKIKDKETFHLLDSTRYLLSAIRPGVPAPNDKPGTVIRQTGSGANRKVSIIGKPLRVDENGRIVRGQPKQLVQAGRVEREGL